MKIKKAITRIKFWFEKQFDPQFMWGHPDEWSEAEWYYYEKERDGK